MLKRIGAIALIVLLVGMYVATFVMGVTGRGNFMGMIFLDVVIPVLGCMADSQSPKAQG